MALSTVKDICAVEAVVEAKPQILERLKPIISVSGEILYSLNLQKFYPKDIKISWTCGTEKSQEMISSNNIVQKNPDATFNVCSEIRLNGELLKDPSFLANVTWEHESMDTPGNKQLSLRDPAKPQVMELIHITFADNSRVQFSLKLQRFHPKDIQIIWTHGEKQYVANSSQSITENSDLTYDAVNLLKPKVQDPVQITLQDGGNLRLTLNLMSFCPKDIGIKWDCTDANTQCKKFHYNPTENSEKTWNVSSSYRVPGNLFKNPTFKVCVTWTHESMDAPESRKLSVRDFPWHPQLEDIKVPTLEANKDVTLECKLSEYFPDALTMTWYKKQNGKEEETKLPATGYRVPDIKSLKQKDNTFACKACVTLSPVQSKDRGAEFIYRVKHPTLKHPIDRSTGPLVIGGLGKGGK
ncbi:uncharacterized protein O3C94_018989 [Discoglossus pictus]